MTTKKVVKFTVFKKLNDDTIKLIRECDDIIEASDFIENLCNKDLDDYYRYSTSDFEQYYFTQTFHLEIER
jgi:hypothetical protein